MICIKHLEPGIKKLDGKLDNLGFKKSLLEHAIYSRGSGADRVVLGIYVDEVGNNKQH